MWLYRHIQAHSEVGLAHVNSIHSCYTSGMKWGNSSEHSSAVSGPLTFPVWPWTHATASLLKIIEQKEQTNILAPLLRQVSPLLIFPVLWEKLPAVCSVHANSLSEGWGCRRGATFMGLVLVSDLVNQRKYILGCYAVKSYFCSVLRTKIHHRITIDWYLLLWSGLDFRCVCSCYLK